jgi:hypothetical protein
MDGEMAHLPCVSQAKSWRSWREASYSKIGMIIIFFELFLGYDHLSYFQ